MARKRGAFWLLILIGLAALIALLWWTFARMGLFRPAMRDAVFVRRIEDMMKKGEDIEAEENAGAARV